MHNKASGRCLASRISRHHSEHSLSPVSQYYPTRWPLPLKMKKLRIFRNVNWEPTEMRRRSPPFQLSDFQQLTDKKKFSFDPSCSAILETALARHMPRFPANFYYSRDPLDINKLDAVAPNLDELSRSGMTPHRIRQLLEDFNFVNERGLHNGELSWLTANSEDLLLFCSLFLCNLIYVNTCSIISLT